MVRAGSGNGVFRQRSLVFLPLEYQRFCQIVQRLCGNDNIAADVAVKNVLIGIVNAFGNAKVSGRMRCQTARISMVACLAAARCGIERLRQFAAVRRQQLFGGNF